MTFDGKSYSFDENCTYYLVKEIITKYNLTIMVNRHYCNPPDSSFCSLAVTVVYKSYTVLLAQLNSSGTTTAIRNDVSYLI